ncbi:hypothetical protein [Sphingomonas suaedae]|uniref:hypothetical protein n=1 Tax=Sphingomonas suaedae TaxID=2599297 RepID=UPI0016480900|nr:hypothetical protein [Sphingomonas suaedae]
MHRRRQVVAVADRVVMRIAGVTISWHLIMITIAMEPLGGSANFAPTRRFGRMHDRTTDQTGKQKKSGKNAEPMSHRRHLAQAARD